MNSNSIFLNYYEDMKDLIISNPICSMKKFRQHGSVDCLSHSILVSYLSYLIAYKYNLDYVSAGRAGLLHDLFLYDTKKDLSIMPYHLVTHASIALKNALENFALNDKEKNIIESHMWPLGNVVPGTKEAFLVNLMDKLSMVIECLGLYKYVTRNILGIRLKAVRSELLDDIY